MQDEQKMSLVNIKDGAAVEAFDRCLVNVLNNINDINTDTKPRKIVLTVTLAPTADRGLMGIGVECVSHFRPQEQFATTAVIQHGYCVEVKPKQRGVFENVTEIKGGKKS
jgi:hypothetical protein